MNEILRKIEENVFPFCVYIASACTICPNGCFTDCAKLNLYNRTMKPDFEKHNVPDTDWINEQIAKKLTSRGYIIRIIKHPETSMVTADLSITNVIIVDKQTDCCPEPK